MPGMAGSSLWPDRTIYGWKFLSPSPGLVTACRTVWSLIYAKNNSRIQNWSQTDWETDRQAIVSCQQEQQHLLLLGLFMILLDFHNHCKLFLFYACFHNISTYFSDKALALFRSLYEYILENGRARSSSPLSTWYCQYGHSERLFNHCLNGNLCLLIISTAIWSV